MLHHLADIFDQVYCLSALYDTSFRMVAGGITAFSVALLAFWLQLKSARFFRAPVREDTPERHQAKNNTPTMGGIAILVSVFITASIWCEYTPEVGIFLASLFGFGLIGFWDDFCKLRYKKGIREFHKLSAQILVASLAIFSWYFFIHPDTTLVLPLMKGIPLGRFLIPWAIFIVVGASNAVNLTDGLDGLASASLLPAYSSLSCICLIAANYAFALHLHIPLSQTLEIAVIGAILTGTVTGFLWYNSYPAQLFMGDVGSLALGSALALMALMARQELLLALIGGVFVIETLSVILQVISFKVCKKRLFRMAPLHHHFELIGVPEAKISLRAAILSTLLCIGALALLPH